MKKRLIMVAVISSVLVSAFAIAAPTVKVRPQNQIADVSVKVSPQNQIANVSVKVRPQNQIANVSVKVRPTIAMIRIEKPPVRNV